MQRKKLKKSGKHNPTAKVWTGERCWFKAHHTDAFLPGREAAVVRRSRRGPCMLPQNGQRLENFVAIQWFDGRHESKTHQKRLPAALWPMLEAAQASGTQLVAIFTTDRHVDRQQLCSQISVAGSDTPTLKLHSEATRQPFHMPIHLKFRPKPRLCTTKAFGNEFPNKK